MHFNDYLRARTIEPRKRLVAGSFGWAHHRFPVKDGISLREAMARDLCTMPPQWGDLFAATPGQELTK